MKISVIGTGYVGLVAGACLADMGNEVICVDNNAEKIANLIKGIIPIFEPGLEELVKINVQEHHLSFSTDLKFAVQNSEVCFIAVGTPMDRDGGADLSFVLEVAKQIAQSMNGYKVIVDKSTVPVGTAAKVEQVIKQYTSFPFDVVSNPEFLKQGHAVEDFLRPDRIVIGADSDKAIAIMQDIYSSFFRLGNRVLLMDVKSAEMTKYAANSFLATKISFINEIANLCEEVGANIEMVRLGISTDSRIGGKFLFPGVGYGGSCFPKDVRALAKIGKENGVELSIIQAVDEVNAKQRQKFLQKIKDHFTGNLKGRTIAIWGLAFKPQTDDMREAPSVFILNELLKEGCRVVAYDPKAMTVAHDLYFQDKIQYASSSYEALCGADCLVLLTEWNEFRRPDFEKIKNILKFPVIFDGRNQYDRKKMRKQGFIYYCIG